VEHCYLGSAKDFIIKAVLTDPGGEYTSKAFQREPRTCEIKFQSTVPYMAQEDGISENSNGVLGELTHY